MTSPEPLIACLLEIERYVQHGGWDQPARLFALVPTAELVAAEPGLAEQLNAESAPPDALSSIEQDGVELRSAAGEDLLAGLEHISWPATVFGCALAVERTFLPPALEAQIPDDPAEAARFVARHPERQEVRVVVGATRDGAGHGVGRLRASGDLFGDPNLVPGLARALARTLD